MNGHENTYVKQRAGAPSGFFATEAAGLRWLAAASADGGVDVVEVLDQDATSVTLERLDEARPSDGVDAAAARFGRATDPAAVFDREKTQADLVAAGLELTGALGGEALLVLALAAYATYVVNAGQFVLKLRAARLQGAGPAPRLAEALS